jgi:hypothetical protein
MKKEIKTIYMSMLNMDSVKTKIKQRGISLEVEEFFPCDQTMLCNVTSFYIGDREIFPCSSNIIDDFCEVIERFDR